MALTNGLSIVCPVYCSVQTLNELVDQISTSLNNFSDYEVVLVDDRSTDDSWIEITRLAKTNSKIRGIRLGRNVGQHGALLAGVRSATFNTIVTLDDDLQNPPSQILKLVEALHQRGGVIYGTSSIVEQSWWRKFFSRFAKRLFHRVLGFNSAVSISSFRAFSTDLRDAFANDLGPNISLDSLLTWSTSNFSTVNVLHEKRRLGKSNYSFRKLVRFMVDTATGYSSVPLRFATTIGLLVTLFGFLLFLWVTIRPWVTGTTVPGFPLLASSIAIFSGTQLLMLGILGEYIGKIHFRVMNQPTFIISEKTE